VGTDKELEEELTEISGRIERLRVQYQQYFLGMEKIPPVVQREQLERRIRHSPLRDIRKSAIKFRFQTTIQRLRTLEVYWDRVVREIENGRYVRGIFRDGAARGVKRPGDDSKKTGDKAKPSRSRQQAEKGERVVKPGVVKEESIDSLYRQYIDARETVGMPTEGVTLESFRVSLDRQREVHMKRLGVKRVVFSVKIKDDKVVLEARPLSQ